MKPRILFCLFLTVLSSCSTIEYLQINVQKPAQVTLPADIRNITIVNNAITQPDSINHLFLATQIGVPADSINTILTSALAQFMDEEQFFDQVIAYQESLRKNGFFLTETGIEQDKIRLIATETNADAVIALNRFVVQLNSSYNGNITADIQAKFRIYDAKGEPIGEPILYEDDFKVYYDYRFEHPLPEMKQSLKLSAIHTAEDMALILTPHWQQQDRWFYYSGHHKETREAGHEAIAGRWKEAALKWGEVYNREKNLLKKANLASNIALANEMLDDVENALTWATISYNLYVEYGVEKSQAYLSRIASYRKELETRLEEFKKLDRQAGVAVE